MTMAYPSDRKYTKDHEWLLTSGDVAEVGITAYAQQQLGDVVYVDLPEPGATISAGESFGSIESVKAVSELFAPISGEVVDVNGELKDHPERVNSDPHSAWMIRIRPANPADAAALLDSAQYQALLG
jgi:glycine cleavage system H protein